MAGEHAARLHHVNFLVARLPAAVDRFEAALGLSFGAEEQLPERGVRLRRARAGEAWIVLVEPSDPDGVAARMLAARGEGVMLLSFEVDGLDRALARAEAAGACRQGPTRAGLDAWRVADLDPSSMFGVPLQLLEDGAPEGGEAQPQPER
jgi:methylmalonyl-CoA/ethylmalonyl-CoA epimerase